ncbi:hypothetical protein CA984_42590, partial [Streptosporangium minutum]
GEGWDQPPEPYLGEGGQRPQVRAGRQTHLGAQVKSPDQALDVYRDSLTQQTEQSADFLTITL